MLISFVTFFRLVKQLNQNAWLLLECWQETMMDRYFILMILTLQNGDILKPFSRFSSSFLYPLFAPLPPSPSFPYFAPLSLNLLSLSPVSPIFLLFSPSLSLSPSIFPSPYHQPQFSLLPSFSALLRSVLDVDPPDFLPSFIISIPFVIIFYLNSFSLILKMLIHHNISACVSWWSIPTRPSTAISNFVALWLGDIIFRKVAVESNLCERWCGIQRPRLL